MQVLFVEDDELIRVLFTELLGEHDIEVGGLTNAEDALVLLASGQVPDVLVIDLNLGLGIDGFDLAEMARAKHPDVGIVFVSGEAYDAHKHRFGEHERFLQKPFRSEELLTAIRDAAG